MPAETERSRRPAVPRDQFVFNERKSAQAAAFLLNRCGGELPYIALLKMLYLADRETLKEIGRPITGDRAVSMDYGPVLSRIKTLIDVGTGLEGAGHQWVQYVSPSTDYVVRAMSPNPDDGELSDYEIEVLSRIADEYGALRWDELVEVTHALPEWEHPHGSSLPIELRDILGAVGKTPEEIDAILAEAAELRFIAQPPAHLA